MAPFSPPLFSSSSDGLDVLFNFTLSNQNNNADFT